MQNIYLIVASSFSCSLSYADSPVHITLQPGLQAEAAVYKEGGMGVTTEWEQRRLVKGGKDAEGGWARLLDVLW